MLRRTFLTTAATHGVAAAILPGMMTSAGFAQAIPEASAPTDQQPVKPFAFDDVVALTIKRAEADFVSPRQDLVGSFKNLNYDQYRGIRFQGESDPLKDHDRFRIDLLSPGLIFGEPVQISMVENGAVRPLPFSPRMLSFDPSVFPEGADMETVGKMGWSGFRLRTPLNRPDVMDEFIVFQGASYFRAVARDTLYGLSARGLAINTGGADGEEFPLFTDFWIHRPEQGASTIRIHAILDSISVAGAFQFDVTPGAQTTVVTRVVLVPRTELKSVGIAPLTSMFWFGPSSHAGIDDYRPAVHDSDGLQMITGGNQNLWRVLNAPKKLQISGFVDENPRGFGLVQRERRFDSYQDAEARYDKRPSGWVQPLGDWGKGQVGLVEIPVENEFNDNIVSFWSPSAPMAAHQQHSFDYRMTFSTLPPVSAALAKVVQTRTGKPVNDAEGITYVVDFEAGIFRDEMPVANVSASQGRVVNAHVLRLEEEDVLRLAFLFVPESNEIVELRAELQDQKGVALSETWMDRWSR